MLAKKFLLVLTLFLSVPSHTEARNIDKYVTGGWGDPAQSGHGLSIELLNDQLAVAFWYSHNPDGTSMFLVMVGTIAGNTMSGSASYFSGMKFGEFDPNTLVEEPWGNFSITFHDCSTATLNYSSTLLHKGVPFGSGIVNLQKLVSPPGLQCTESPFAGNYHATATGSGEIATGAGVAFENNILVYLAQSLTTAEVGFASLTQTGADTFSWFGEAYSVTGGVIPFSGNGTITDFGLEGGTSKGQNIVATRTEIFQENLSFSHIAGNYTITDQYLNLAVGSINISGIGTVSGSTSTGCSVSGTSSIPNNQFNQIIFNVNLSNCATPVQIVAAGIYLKKENAILVIGADGQFGYYWKLN